MDRQLLKRLRPLQHLPGTRASAGYAEVTFGAPIVRQAFVAGKLQMIKNNQGEDIQSSLELFVDGVFVISHHDQFTVDGQNYPVLGFEKFNGLSPGTGTTVVYV